MEFSLDIGEDSFAFGDDSEVAALFADQPVFGEDLLDFGDDALELLGDDDDMGYDGLHGDDLDAILGGRGKRKRVAARREQPGLQHQVLPFPRTTVAAATTVTVTAFPQRKFRTERFLFAGSVAANFTVDELKVGQESMLVQTGNIPAELFSQLGVGVALQGYIARPGVTVSLTVTNTSAGPLAVAAAIIGPALV